MSRNYLQDNYTALERDLIHRLAEIEQSDRDLCAGCGGEDCLCCEIYLDRQRWQDPDEMIAQMRDEDLYAWEDNCDEDEDDEWPEDDEAEDEEDEELDGWPETRAPAPRGHDYPCDEGPDHRCPFITSENESTGMYFCRDHCGLGVDD